MKLGKRKFESLKELVAYLAPSVRQPKRPPAALTKKQRREGKTIDQPAAEKTFGREN